MEKFPYIGSDIGSAEDQDWRHNALCGGDTINKDVFFMEDGERGVTRARKEQAARAVCLGCAAINDCLEYALNKPEHFGVWGGATEGQRRKALASGPNSAAYTKLFTDR